MTEAAAAVPALGGTQLSYFLLHVGVLVALATLLGRIAARLGLAALVGELLTGIVLGPSLLASAWPGSARWLLPATPEQWHLLDGVGQIGVILFVGITAMRLDLGMLRRRGITAVTISLPGLVIPLGLGVGAGLLLPAAFLIPGTNRATFALFVGVAMCVSAIPVIAKTLTDLKLLHRNIGQLILITGTVDDLLGWLGLSIVTAMATTGLRAAGVARSLLVLALFLLVAFTAGRLVVRAVLRWTLRSAEPGTTVAAAVGVVLLTGALSNVLGLEAIFGALVAGLVIQATGPEVLERLRSLPPLVLALLAPLFFAIAGLRMNLGVLRDPEVLLAGVVLLLLAVAGKFAGAFLGAKIGRLNRWEALALAAGMNARGVVEVVVATVGMRLGLLNQEMYTIIILIAVATSVMGPPILRKAMSRVEITADEQLRERETDFAPASPV